MVHSRVVFSSLLLAALATGLLRPVGAQESGPVRWESPAKFHPLLKKAVPGDLTVNGDAIEFKSPKVSLRWPYREIKTFDLTENHELVITDYGNRRWHGPGERTYRFTLAQPMPAGIANQFAARVARPVINGIPLPSSNILGALPAHRRERFGGSNGTLNFRQDGIDYLATDGHSSRTWRWSDIQTIASPNPWEFRITGYHEIAEFDLKQSLSRELFDRLWNIFYAVDLNLTSGMEGHRQ